MYSDMSTLIMFFSESKSSLAKLLASSVLPTPVGPRNRKDPIGRWLADRPALALPSQ